MSVPYIYIVIDLVHRCECNVAAHAGDRLLTNEMLTKKSDLISSTFFLTVRVCGIILAGLWIFPSFHIVFCETWKINIICVLPDYEPELGWGDRSICINHVFCKFILQTLSIVKRYAHQNTNFAKVGKYLIQQITLILMFIYTYIYIFDFINCITDVFNVTGSCRHHCLESIEGCIQIWMLTVEKLLIQIFIGHH